MAQLFVSDLHLEDSRPDITRAFFHLLDSLSGRFSELYLLGDIFEVWLGDDTPAACAAALADKLAGLSQSGIDVFLMHGNRDFLLGEDFTQRCGAKLIHEPFCLSVAGKKTVLLHGDVLCTRDTDYLAFRQMVRNPVWQHAVLAKPLDERIAIGRELRDKSQQSGQQKAEYIMDVTEDAVTAMMEAYSAELMIHGHTHRPATHKVVLPKANANATRMVLGDWYAQGWYILADEDNVTLNAFPFPITD